MAEKEKDSKGTRVLVIDDEEAIRNVMQAALEEEGYAVRTAADGADGLKAFFAWQPSLVLLDVLMPKMDGWKVLERIREVSDTPVIMLTALGQEDHKVRGLRHGADDYVVKPVQLKELSARIEAIFRRVKETPDKEQVYRDEALYIDFARHQVFRRGKEVSLSPQEFRLLAALVSKPGVVLSTERLLDTCWGEGEGGPENVRVYIGYLRKKLADDADLIETIREFGYRYRPPSAG